MPKRKKHHKKGRKTHHRRMGALHTAGLKDAIISTVGVAAGIIGGRLLNNMINPSPAPGATVATSPKIRPAILGGATAAVGVFAAMKLKNPAMKAIAMGLAGNGIMYALSSKGLNVLPASVGYPPPNAVRPPRPMLNGFRDVPKIGNFPRPTVIGAPRDHARMARQYAGVYGC